MPACPSAPCFSPEATGSVPLLRRLLPGFLPWGPATPARIWLRRGGLEGCLRDAGLAAAQRRTLLAGAAALIRVAPVRLQTTPRPARP